MYCVEMGRSESEFLSNRLNKTIRMIEHYHCKREQEQYQLSAMLGGGFNFTQSPASSMLPALRNVASMKELKGLL